MKHWFWQHKWELADIDYYQTVLFGRGDVTLLTYTCSCGRVEQKRLNGHIPREKLTSARR